MILGKHSVRIEGFLPSDIKPWRLPGIKVLFHDVIINRERLEQLIIYRVGQRLLLVYGVADNDECEGRSVLVYRKLTGEITEVIH